MSATWLKNAGSILIFGDSTVVQGNGWAETLYTALASAGYHQTFVGPVALGSLFCLGYANQVIADFRTGAAHDLSAAVATYKPTILIDALGWNDERSVVGITPATYKSRKTALYDEAWAARPGMTLVIMPHMPCTAGDPAANPVAGLAACNATIATNNATTAAELASYWVGLGGRAAVAGSFDYPTVGSNDLDRSDSVHQVTTANGNPRMSPPCAVALQVAKPA